jgi:hypothetical protein
MSNTVFVTGAGGNVGSATVRALRKEFSSVNVIAGVHDLKKAEKSLDPDVKRVAFGTDRPETLSNLQGALSVIIIAGNHSKRKEQMLDTIQAAKQFGVKHLVLLSITLAEASIPFGKDFRVAEQALKQSGLSYTVVRSDFYMVQNNMGSPLCVCLSLSPSHQVARRRTSTSMQTASRTKIPCMGAPAPTPNTRTSGPRMSARRWLLLPRMPTVSTDARSASQAQSRSRSVPWPTCTPRYHRNHAHSLYLTAIGRS